MIPDFKCFCEEIESIYKDLLLLKDRVKTNDDITSLILKKAQEKGISESISDIRIIDNHAIREIVKGLIKNA